MTAPWHSLPWRLFGMVSGQQIKAKILVLGPVKSGKTVISNYLADANDMSVTGYRPTRGVRIVEFESNDLEINGERVEAEVELWDCSGDKQFQQCWPAIRRSVDGVILVCRPDKYKEFVERANINPSHVLVLLHTTSEMTNDAPIADFRLALRMKELHVVPSDTDRNGDALRLEFNSFLCRVISDAKLRNTA